MKKTLVNVVKFGVSIGLGVLLVWLAVRKLTSNDINEMREAFSRSNWFWLIVGPAIGMASNLVRAERWNMLLRSIGYRAKFWNVAAAVYVMYIGNLAFPRLGEISRCGIVYTTDGIPVEKSIGTMVVERLVDVVTMLAVGVILFFLQYDLLQTFFNQYLVDPIKSKLNIGDGSMLIKLGLMVLLAIVFGVIFLKVKNSKVGKMIQEKVMGLLYGINSIRTVENPLLFVFYSILIWAMYFVMQYCNFMALTETAHLGAIPALAILFFGAFAFIATQGGIGAYPLVVREILLLYGISANIGYAFGWISWSLQTLMVLVSGLIALGYLAFVKRSKTGIA